MEGKPGKGNEYTVCEKYRKQRQIRRPYNYLLLLQLNWPTSTGQRRIKLRGSSKTGGHCTAYLVVTQEGGGDVHARVHTTYYGHDSELGHIQLPAREREAS